MGYQPTNATGLDQYDKFHIQDLLSLGFSPYEIWGIAEKIGWERNIIEKELERLGHPLERSYDGDSWCTYIRIPRQYKSIIKQILKAMR